MNKLNKQTSDLRHGEVWLLMPEKIHQVQIQKATEFDQTFCSFKMDDRPWILHVLFFFENGYPPQR